MIFVDIHTLKIIVSMDRLNEYQDCYNNLCFDNFENFVKKYFLNESFDNMFYYTFN